MKSSVNPRLKYFFSSKQYFAVGIFMKPALDMVIRKMFSIKTDENHANKLGLALEKVGCDVPGGLDPIGLAHILPLIIPVII